MLATVIPARDNTIFSAQVERASRFFLPATRSPRPQVVAAGCEWCQPDYRIDRPGFRFWGLEIVRHGTAEVRLAGRDSLLPPGGAFLYGPSVPHQILPATGPQLAKYFVLFKVPPKAAELSASGLQPGEAFLLANPEQVFAIIEDLIRMGRSDHAARERYCAAALEYLLLAAGDQRRPLETVDHRAFSTYQHCREYIARHFQTLQSVTQVAEACELDQAYLCRLFRKFGRESPYKYLLHLKMSRAMEQLQHTDRTVQDIAACLAFSDPFTFSRAFKRHYGVAPANAR